MNFVADFSGAHVITPNFHAPVQLYDVIESRRKINLFDECIIMKTQDKASRAQD